MIVKNPFANRNSMVSDQRGASGFYKEGLSSAFLSSNQDLAERGDYAQIKRLQTLCIELSEENKKLKSANKKLKETVKVQDHQVYVLKKIVSKVNKEVEKPLFQENELYRHKILTSP